MINQNQGYGYYPTQDQLVQPQLNRQYMCIPVQNINEAYNWGIAPGSFLIFLDADGIHHYTKSLSSPYDKPVFSVFTKEQDAPAQQDTNDVADLREEISRLKEAMKKLNNKIAGKAGD